jgi:hypothetical protein
MNGNILTRSKIMFEAIEQEEMGIVTNASALVQLQMQIVELKRELFDAHNFYKAQNKAFYKTLAENQVLSDAHKTIRKEKEQQKKDYEKKIKEIYKSSKKKVFDLDKIIDKQGKEIDKLNDFKKKKLKIINKKIRVWKKKKEKKRLT